MKNVTFCLLIVVVIICNFTQVLALNTDDYSIDIPTTYRKNSEGIYKSTSGIDIYIQENDNYGNATKIFSKEFLDLCEKDLNNQVEQLKTEVRKSHGNVVDNETNELLKSFKLEEIEKREIIKATKNNYKCAHIRARYILNNTKYYKDMYVFASYNKSINKTYSYNRIYTITLTSINRNSMDSSEVKKIIDSFTIKNYKEPSIFVYYFNRYFNNYFVKVMILIFFILAYKVGKRSQIVINKK